MGNDEGFAEKKQLLLTSFLTSIPPGGDIWAQGEDSEIREIAQTGECLPSHPSPGSNHFFAKGLGFSVGADPDTARTQIRQRKFDGWQNRTGV